MEEGKRNDMMALICYYFSTGGRFKEWELWHTMVRTTVTASFSKHHFELFFIDGFYCSKWLQYCCLNALGLSLSTAQPLQCPSRVQWATNWTRGTTDWTWTKLNYTLIRTAFSSTCLNLGLTQVVVELAFETACCSRRFTFCFSGDILKTMKGKGTFSWTCPQRNTNLLAAISRMPPFVFVM